MVKNPPANAGDSGSISGSGRSPEEGNGNPLQYSYLENPMDRGAWQATVHGVAKKPDTTQRLNKTATTKNLTISSSYIPKISFSNCKCNLINN